MPRKAGFAETAGSPKTAGSAEDAGRGPLPDYNSGNALGAFLRERGLGIRKKWGQHFLVNPRAREGLVEALDIRAGDGVFEIGPGMGAMTSLLLEKGARVTAFEIDGGFSSILRELFPGGSFTIVSGDVLKTWEQNDDGSPYLFGNLPYTIAAVLMGNFIEQGRFFRRIVITVQKEVALRMAAKPGGRNYSSISALCASAYDIKPLMTLKPPSFYPPPRVDSAALLFTLRTDEKNNPLFARLVRALFASRRKTVVNNLEHFLSVSGILGAGRRSRDCAEAVLLRSGIPPGERAENLDYVSFNALADVLENNRNGK
ncbi:MAG: 16S rRNA (adenine(1518)-N(6)/adenine(1519)-N(6))-dimethyltransferase RsmA [Treponema sp.]|nr:16S rRNA (adenine(1518)-N(6)/adenine(1519)-N(6))-dimethyltransferase RsmA [Treponema sp.]